MFYLNRKQNKTHLETEKRLNNGDIGAGDTFRPKSGYVNNSGRGGGGNGGGGGGGGGVAGGESYGCSGGGGGARSVSSSLGKPVDLLNTNIL